MATELEAARDAVCKCVKQAGYLREVAEFEPCWRDQAQQEISLLARLIEDAEAWFGRVSHLLDGRVSPEPIGDVYGAGYHDQGLKFAREVLDGLWSHADIGDYTLTRMFGGSFDPERRFDKGDADDPSGLAGALRYMREGCPEFSADKLVSLVRAEAAQAIRESESAAPSQLTANGANPSDVTTRLDESANTTPDTNDDTPKKKARTMGGGAITVARKWREAFLSGDETVAIKREAEDYVENGGKGSVTTSRSAEDATRFAGRLRRP